MDKKCEADSYISHLVIWLVIWLAGATPSGLGGLWGVAIFIILFLSIFRFPCYHLVLPMGEKPEGGGVGGLGCRYFKKHPLQLVEHLNDLDNNFINLIFLKSVIWHDCHNFMNI